MPLKNKLACHLVEEIELDAAGNSTLVPVSERLRAEMNAQPFQDWCKQPWTGESGDP
jgi:hypothetical protein